MLFIPGVLVFGYRFRQQVPMETLLRVNSRSQTSLTRWVPVWYSLDTDIVVRDRWSASSGHGGMLLFFLSLGPVNVSEI